VHAGFAMTLVTVGLMVTLRHLLRLAYLRPYLQQEVANVHPQTSVIILFLALFVGGLITVSYMLWKVQSAKSNSDTQSRRVAHV